VDGQLLLAVELGEKEPVRALLLLDTAATRSLLDLSVARQLPAFRSTGNRQVAVYGGAAGLAGSVGAVTLGVGPARVRLTDVPVVDISVRSRLSGIRVAGLLGLDVLGRRPFEIDLSRGVVRLESGGER
jgi:hypothetical protein